MPAGTAMANRAKYVARAPSSPPAPRTLPGATAPPRTLPLCGIGIGLSGGRVPHTPRNQTMAADEGAGILIRTLCGTPASADRRPARHEQREHLQSAQQGAPSLVSAEAERAKPGPRGVTPHSAQGRERASHSFRSREARPRPVLATSAPFSLAHTLSPHLGSLNPKIASSFFFRSSFLPCAKTKTDPLS